VCCWFARRGFGYSAVQGTTNRNDNDEAFDTHPDCRKGFEPPIESGEDDVNVVRAGRAVPLRFDLGSNQGLDVLASNSPFSRRVDCDTFEVPSANPPFITPREAPVATTSPGNSGLSVDDEGVYEYVWKTQQGWAGTCREVVLTRADGVQHRAFFELRS
jgi:extracellular elastinolytic metalloproteinase